MATIIRGDNNDQVNGLTLEFMQGHHWAITGLSLDYHWANSQLKV
ncbi:MAG: hypothetical protein ABG776_07160 [Cyanobacteria bacterium J06555_13]